MKICLIGDGQSVHMARWSKWMRSRGHEVLMLSVTPVEENQKSSYDDVIEVKVGLGALSFMMARRPIRSLVRQFKPDIVHGQYLTAGGYFAAVSGGPIIITSAWGSDVYVDAQESVIKRHLVKIAIRRSDYIFADSDHLIAAVRSLHPVGNRLQKIVFGIDPKEFFPKLELRQKNFTFISIRLTRPLYNPILILEAFERIAEKTDSRLLIQIPWKGSEDIGERIEKSRVRDRITLYPWIPHSEMCNLLNSAHVGISAPNTDSSGASMLEAMACGVPVIASDIPQNREWIADFVDGYTFKPGSVESLAEKMLLAYNNQNIKIMGENARKMVVERASFDTEMEKALKIYEQAMK